jgi:hypothetical protein
VYIRLWGFHDGISLAIIITEGIKLPQPLTAFIIRMASAVLVFNEA